MLSNADIRGKDLNAMWLWHLGTWVSGGFGISWTWWSQISFPKWRILWLSVLGGDGALSTAHWYQQEKVLQPHLHLPKGFCWMETAERWIGGSRAASPEEGWGVCSSQVKSRNQGSWTKGLKTRHCVTVPEESLLPAENFNSSMRGQPSALHKSPLFTKGM